MDRRMFKRVATFFMGGLFSLIFTIVALYLVYACTLKAFDYGKTAGNNMSTEKPPRDVEITLAEGATIAEVSKLLKQKGVIENSMLYRLESILKGTDDNFSAGTYTVNTSMDSNEINATLRKTAVVSTDVKITILEGYSIADIASYLADKEIVSAEDFIETCEAGEFKYAFLADVPERQNRLEGYLFPDTYFISSNADSEEIINKMLKRFEEMYDADCVNKAEQAGLTMDQAITIASMIEKEVRIPEEQVKVSAIIKNRLAQDMPLQMPSTVVYILDKSRKRLTEADLKVESPYNTYVNKGLPAGPISNPGKACIDAALSPEESDALYFVLKDEETGEHIFTNNNDEFIEAKTLYNQQY